jgi:hypothetical protein
MSYQEHKCSSRTDGFDIFFNGKQWVIQGYCYADKPIFDFIEYCPYCGEKLVSQ